MTKRCYTVADLASEANLNVDDTLLRLWGNGIECAENGTQIFSAKKLKQVRRVLGIASGSDYSSPRFWQHKLGLNEADFFQLLNRLGIPFEEGKRSLPKGSIKKLKNELRKISDHYRVAELKESHNNVVAQQVIPEYHWELVGDVREVRYLTTDQVRGIHYALVEDFAQQKDPISPPGVHSDGLLDSALHRARTSLGGDLKYPTVAMSCAALVHSLVHDHPFHNGNKRTALVAMMVFLDENRFMLHVMEKSCSDLF